LIEDHIKYRGANTKADITPENMNTTPRMSRIKNMLAASFTPISILKGIMTRPKNIRPIMRITRFAIFSMNFTISPTMIKDTKIIISQVIV
jgi:hypothetical protein